MSLAIKRKLKEARDKDSHSSFSAIWNRVQKENPDLFAKLQALDKKADDESEPPKQYPDVRKMSLAEHKAMFALEKLKELKLERPKRVEATHQEGFICVGGFSNPLF